MQIYHYNSFFYKFEYPFRLPFLTDGSERATWSKQSKNVKIYNRLAPATTKFFDEFFRYSGNVKAKKFGDRQVRLITVSKAQIAFCFSRYKS